MRHYLAIDAGTGSGRAVLFDETGREVAAEAREWWHAGDPRYPGSMDFDTAGNWAMLAECCRAVIARSGVDPARIAGVSATSMREAFVLHDASGREIWACANVDARAEAEVLWLKENHADLERRLYRATGQTFALGALPRLLWLQRHAPETLQAARHLTMLSDWILYRLSGELVCEASNAGTTGLVDLRDRRPVPGALEEVGLPEGLFPRAAATGETVGTISAAAARETGLAPGTPVIAGGGDCQIGSFALGATRAGDCAIMGGTFWQTVVNVGAEVSDPSMRLRINPHVVPGLNQCEAISFFTGAVMRWFRDAFGQGRDYAAIEAESRQVPPGAHGILPIFSDVMRYDAWFHAAPSLLNLPLDPERGGPAAIFRALQENAAVVAARNLDAVTGLLGRRPERIVFAGGASKSAHWSQILADVTGLPVVTPQVKEATALGCAAAAATGAGQFDTLEAAGRAWFRPDAEYRPDPGLKPLYDALGERWAKAYAVQRTLAAEGVTTPMWRAPGIQ
ncbi:autoinducer-2 kinase [Limimaricola pyoseonensis]|uniref:Autoinducer 2 (AI-2) kinase n=1 Tax=Limimaricola pyoseonensis TaxID=521013 RepID=A0A1G7IL61_9RHOB|nr:autoinducer-2 kinase [Limimaricola pyoseonensis]SDF13441.1 autoinducer 2 (AI-2) kinase [Limimaricola pyoseonensis]